MFAENPVLHPAPNESFVMVTTLTNAHFLGVHCVPSTAKYIWESTPLNGQHQDDRLQPRIAAGILPWMTSRQKTRCV